MILSKFCNPLSSGVSHRAAMSAALMVLLFIFGFLERSAMNQELKPGVGMKICVERSHSIFSCGLVRLRSQTVGGHGQSRESRLRAGPQRLFRYTP